MNNKNKRIYFNISNKYIKISVKIIFMNIHGYFYKTVFLFHGDGGGKKKKKTETERQRDREKGDGVCVARRGLETAEAADGEK